MRRRFAGVLLCAVGVLGVTQHAKAGDVFHMMVFVSESNPKQLRYSHTYATFVRVTGEGSDPAKYTSNTSATRGPLACPTMSSSRSFLGFG